MQYKNQVTAADVVSWPYKVQLRDVLCGLVKKNKINLPQT